MKEICNVKGCNNETFGVVLKDKDGYHNLCPIHHAEMPTEFEFKETNENHKANNFHIGLRSNLCDNINV